MNVLNLKNVCIKVSKNMNILKRKEKVCIYKFFERILREK